MEHHELIIAKYALDLLVKRTEFPERDPQCQSKYYSRYAEATPVSLKIKALHDLPDKLEQ